MHAVIAATVSSCRIPIIAFTPEACAPLTKSVILGARSRPFRGIQATHSIAIGWPQRGVNDMRVLRPRNGRRRLFAGLSLLEIPGAPLRRRGQRKGDQAEPYPSPDTKRRSRGTRTTCGHVRWKSILKTVGDADHTLRIHAAHICALL